MRDLPREVTSKKANGRGTGLLAFLALGLVAVAFRFGERMQRDTEGLV